MPSHTLQQKRFYNIGCRTGEIYFFETDPSGSELQMDPTLTLRGEAFGAGFGYSMASLDANGDGSPGANVITLLSVFTHSLEQYVMEF
jgi:hypothetical protein